MGGGYECQRGSDICRKWRSKSSEIIKKIQFRRGKKLFVKKSDFVMNVNWKSMISRHVGNASKFFWSYKVCTFWCVWLVWRNFHQEQNDNDDNEDDDDDETGADYIPRSKFCCLERVITIVIVIQVARSRYWPVSPYSLAYFSLY